MANNWAIAIGVNKYWSDSVSLKQAVPDALKMTEWLTDAKGGDVPKEQLYLLTSPRDSETYDLPQGINNRGIASRKNIISAINELVQQSGGRGDRFFFYFSGHGLTSYEEIAPKPAIAFDDFDQLFTDNSLTLSSLWEYFQSSQFKEQFFFIDACRDTLSWNFSYRLGDYPRGPASQLVQDTPSQYMLYATSPGLKAVEIKEGGVFTSVLLDALKNGTGTSKSFNSIEGKYEVTVNLLTKYVTKAILDRKIIITPPNIQPPKYQKPISSIPSTDGSFPVLASFDQVPDVQLDIVVEPNECWQNTRLRVTSEIGDEIGGVNPLPGATISIPLPPRTYTIRADGSPLFQSRKPYWSFDLYDALRAEVVLDPSAVQAEPPIIEPETAEKSLDIDAPVFRSIDLDNVLPTSESGGGSSGDGGFGASDGGGFGGPDDGGFGASDDGGYYESVPTPTVTTASLEVSSPDPLAPLEICDNNGIVIKDGQGQGTLSLKSLEPGIYRTRVVTPEGRASEQIVSLSAGDSERIVLDAPPVPATPAFESIVNRTPFAVRDDNTVTVSETVGPMATARVTTMLALAGSVTREHYGWADKTKDLGLSRFDPAMLDGNNSGLRVIYLDEYSADEEVDETRRSCRFELFRQDDQEHKKSLSLNVSAIDRVSDRIVGAGVGAYFLSLALGEREPAWFSTSVQDGRLTLLIIHCKPDGHLSVMTFAPKIADDGLPAEYEAQDLRRLELLQRFYQNNNVGQHALRDAKDLLNAKFLDPNAGCIGGYTMIRLGRAGDLEVAAGNMTAYYPNLSDSHILMAAYKAATDDPEAERRACEKALDCGIPVFSEGVKLLKVAVELNNMVHPQIKLLNNVYQYYISDIVTTVWTPPKQDS